MNQEAPDIEMRDAADSTVAMTFYNLLAMTRGPMALEELRAAAIRLQHPHISEAQAKRAMDGLVTRGRAAPTSGGYTLLANEKLFVVQRDLGASLLYFGIFVVMIWVATGRVAYLVIGLLLFAAGAYAGWALFDHVQLRVDVWLHALDPAKVFEQNSGVGIMNWQN